MKTFKQLVGCVLMTLLFGSGVAAEEPLPADLAEETMLMFFGETQPMATVASRYPEAPTTAPAMVTVVGREQILQRGYQTLAELLADQPGFFMAAGGRGTVPYLRGLRDSVLFLYDGVPMTTDVTKSFAPLDRDVSLAVIDRVEIVRGPGSVLWGPDAFAGVVNIVPLRGRQQAGGELGLMLGSDDVFGSTLSWGQEGDSWEAYLGLSGVRERDDNPGFMAWQEDNQILNDEVDTSEYAELVGTFNYASWLHVSGRWSDFTRRYTMRNASEEIVWDGEKETPVNHIKVTASKIVGPSHFTLNSFLQETNYKVRDADIEREQRNRVSHLEFLWDRRLFDRGLLSAGISWRRNAVDGALVRDGFLPEFLPPDGPVFVPRIKQEDFVTRLKSVFGQFRYQWGKTALWVGGRIDDHSQYQSTLSYSLGFHRPLADDLHFKATYGTAFRSPYSSQLYDELDFDPEAVSTASAQLTWQPNADRLLELTFFHSRLKDHRGEDPYGGLSMPAARTLYGMELTGQTQISPSVSVRADFTALSDSGRDESFRVLQFCFVRPDGSQVCAFDEWDDPGDTGPNWSAKIGLNWKIDNEHSLDISTRTAGNFEYSYNKDAVSGRYSQPIMIDLDYRLIGIFSRRDTLSLHITNLLDQDYRQPDVYGPIKGPPLQAILVWKYRF